MSNRAHHRPRTQRADHTLVDIAVAISGCTCRPNVVHLGAIRVRIEHDPGCPAEHLGRQIIIAPRQP